MSRIANALISTGLISSGLLMCAWTGISLLNSSELDTPLNPFGINHSPYGEVFAMAMQGPINTDFHVGMYGATDEAIAEAQQKNASSPPGSILIVKPKPAPPQNQPPQTWSPSQKLLSMIDQMEKGHKERTNPLPASEALKFFLRRKAEDKLRFAYQLDPSHYANYNSLHFFLTEGISTRPELTALASQLAEETIEYCLKQEDDPRPALTAAAACTNMLHLMFTKLRKGEPTASTDEMRASLAKLDECIARYHEIAGQWDQNNSWSRLSPQRIDECQTRIGFVTRIRDAAFQTIVRIEKRS